MRPRHKMTEALPVQLDQSRLAAHRRKREALAVIGAKMAKGRLTQPVPGRASLQILAGDCRARN